MSGEFKAAINRSDSIVIRKYKPRDTQAVRELCCDTAYFGEPCENFFPDRELLADLIMKYHTDFEPQHIWIAEYAGQVVGYISACFDETRFRQAMLFRIAPLSFIKALARGKIWDKRMCRLILHNLKSFFMKETSLSKIDTKKFPVNIHQNIKKGFRGSGIGSRLVEALLDEVEANKLPGIRFKALRTETRFPFFEKYGFKRIDYIRVKSMESWLKKSPLYFMGYGKSFCN